MRVFFLAAILLCGLGGRAQNLNFTVPSYNYLNGWFGSKDPRQVADDSQPGELAVHKLLLTEDRWCSAVMIAPQWAVTAAHCIADQPSSIQFYRDNYVEKTIRVDHTWHGRYYGKFWWVNSIPFLYQDFGFVHLTAAAPSWVTFADIARPDEVYAGESAKTVGFPRDQYDGDSKVTAANCSVRRLVVDSILSDCAMSEGNSGGALFVYTRSGEWKLGGIASTEHGHNSDDEEYMVRGGDYTDALANHFLNVSFYSGRIANSVMGYDGEKLSTLSASLTYPVQCLTQFTEVNWSTVSDAEINACEAVQTQAQLDCLSKLFQNPSAMTPQNYDRCVGISLTN